MRLRVPSQAPCPFCENVARRPVLSPRDGVVSRCAVVDERSLTFAFLNPRQLATPHVLVIPSRHAPTLLDLTPSEAAAIGEHIRSIGTAIASLFSPAGLNVYSASGEPAGQSVGHFHTHIVPQYGDMPQTPRSTRDIPRTPFEELESLALRIRAEIE